MTDGTESVRSVPAFRSVVDKGLLGIIAKQVKRGIAFFRSEAEDLRRTADRLTVNAGAAAALPVTGDDRAARLLVAEKEAFRTLEADATAAHFALLRDGQGQIGETCVLHIDALKELKELKRVNAHRVAASAYPVPENKVDLLPSRLR